MLAVSWDTIRLFLHVLAAATWVGGQLVLAALVPVRRKGGVLLADLTSAAKRRKVWQHETADEGKPPCVMTPSRWSGPAARPWSRFPVKSTSRTWTSSGTGCWP